MTGRGPPGGRPAVVLAGPPGERYTGPPRREAIPPTSPAEPNRPRLGIWRLPLAAAPQPLLDRRDRPFSSEGPAMDVADVIRYVAVARRTLRGPLALEIEGPGDPLASPESVLRILSLVREHHPDVLTGLVVDGPLLGEYTEELEEFDLGYLVLRMDAASERTAVRMVDGAIYRGTKLDREEAAALYLDESQRALALARAHDLPVAVRTTLIPTVNRDEVGAIAALAAKGGAERMDVVAHQPRPGAPLATAGAPTDAEMDIARDEVARAFARGPRLLRSARVTDWLHSGRMQDADLDALDAVDFLRTLPDPAETVDVTARVLPPRRAQIIAVASRDGTLVDATLAGAPFLRVYAVSDEGIRCLGVRHLEQDLRRRHDGVGDAQTFLRALLGCRAVVCTALTPRAVTLLKAVGIHSVVIGGRVEDVLDRVARGTIRQVT